MYMNGKIVWVGQYFDVDVFFGRCVFVSIFKQVVYYGMQYDLVCGNLKIVECCYLYWYG